jgi:hypothetical protein
MCVISQSSVKIMAVRFSVTLVVLGAKIAVRIEVIRVKAIRIDAVSARFVACHANPACGDLFCIAIEHVGRVLERLRVAERGRSVAFG